MTHKIEKRLALLGLLGGILYQIGDYFLFLAPGYAEGALPQTCWATMPIGCFEASLWCALIGSACLLGGFVSLYQAVIYSMARPWRIVMLAALPGVIGVMFAHDVVGCLQPMLYQAMLSAGLTDAQFLAVNDALLPARMPLAIFAIISFYLQLIVIGYGLISRRFVLMKRSWLILGGIILTMGLMFAMSFVLPETLSGIAGGFESLFEGVLYLTVYFFWLNREKREATARTDERL